MAFNLGSIFATMTMDTTGYTRGIINAQGLTEAFGPTISTFLTNPILGAVGALEKLSTFADQTLGRFERIAIVSQKTGASVETIQALRRAIEDAGGSTDSADAVLEFFTNRLGELKINGENAAQVFERVGVDFSKFGDDTETAFRAALDAIAALPTESARAAAAQDLFGRANGSLLASIVGTSRDLDGLIERFARIGLVVDADGVASLVRLSDAVDRTKFALRGIGESAVINFLIGLAGGADGASDSIENLAETLIARHGPAMREFGTDVANAAGALSSLVDIVDRVVDRLGKAKEGADQAIKPLVDVAKYGLLDLDYLNVELGLVSPGDLNAEQLRAAAAQRRRAGR